MKDKTITIADMAAQIGVDPNAFQAALRAAKFPPRKAKLDRAVVIDTDEHSAISSVLVTLLRQGHR